MKTNLTYISLIVAVLAPIAAHFVPGITSDALETTIGTIVLIISAIVAAVSHKNVVVAARKAGASI